MRKILTGLGLITLSVSLMPNVNDNANANFVKRQKENQTTEQKIDYASKKIVFDGEKFTSEQEHNTVKGYEFNTDDISLDHFWTDTNQNNLKDKNEYSIDLKKYYTEGGFITDKDDNFLFAVPNDILIKEASFNTFVNNYFNGSLEKDKMDIIERNIKRYNEMLDLVKENNYDENKIYYVKYYGSTNGNERLYFQIKPNSNLQTNEFLDYDKNRDGKIEKQEFVSEKKRLMERFGVLEENEDNLFTKKFLDCKNEYATSLVATISATEKHNFKRLNEENLKQYVVNPFLEFGYEKEKGTYVNELVPTYVNYNFVGFQDETKVLKNDSEFAKINIVGENSIQKLKNISYTNYLKYKAEKNGLDAESVKPNENNGSYDSEGNPLDNVYEDVITPKPEFSLVTLAQKLLSFVKDSKFVEVINELITSVLEMFGSLFN